MIDLSGVKSVLVEIQSLVDELDGIDLKDPTSFASPSGGRTKGAEREERARRSQELQLLATRFELAASLVRNEYWYARGEQDPLNRRRKD